MLFGSILKRSNPAAFLSIIALAVYYGFLLWPFPGAGPDTVSYLRIASGEALKNGWFPPVYPWILKSAGCFGISEIYKLVYLNAACIFAAFFLLWRISARFLPPFAAVLSVLFCLICPRFISPFLYANSEPVFMSVMLLGVYSALKFYEGSVLSGGIFLACMGVLPFIRIAGIAFFPFIFLVFLFHPSPGKKKWVLSLALTLLACIPVLLQIGSQSHSGLYGREFAIYGEALKIWAGYSRLFQTVMPYSWSASWPGWLFTVLFLAFILKQSFRFPVLLKCLLLTAFFYHAFIAFSQLFLDPAIPLDARILLPVAVFFPLFFCAALRETPAAGKKIIFPLIIFILAFSLMNFVRFDKAWRFRENAGEYTSLAWRQHPALEWVKQHPDLKIYSSRSDAIYFILNRRNLEELPPQKSGGILNQIQLEIENRQAAVIFFTVSPRSYLVNEQDLTEALGEPKIQIGDALIWA